MAQVPHKQENLHKKKEGSQLPEETVLRYTSQMLDAVDKLVRTDIAHRDLKCDNIFFTGGQVRLSCHLMDVGPVC